MLTREILPLWIHVSLRRKCDRIQFKLKGVTGTLLCPSGLYIIHRDRHVKLEGKWGFWLLVPASCLCLKPLWISLFTSCFSVRPVPSRSLFFTFPDLWHVIILAFLPQRSWRSWRSSSVDPEHKRVQWAAWKEEDNTASSVSSVTICCCCVQAPHLPSTFSVALPPPQSTPTPALATRIISSGGKSLPLVSYYSFLHQLMMSQSIHKFVVVCRFENFDTAAGCAGMKELSGQAAKMERQGRGDISRREEANQFCLNGFPNDHPLVCIFIIFPPAPPSCLLWVRPDIWVKKEAPQV